MILIAKISSMVGLALFLFGISAPIGALLLLPVQKLMSVNGCRRREDRGPATSMLYDALIAFSWLTWLPYGFLTGAALLGEGRTLFSNAGFGFVYITLGMPAYLVAWLGLVIYAGIRSVPTSWLAGAFAGAVLIVIGCANIG